MNVKATTPDGTTFAGELGDTMLAIANAGYNVEASKFTFVSFTKGEMKWEVPSYAKKAIKAGRETIEEFGRFRMETSLAALEVYCHPDGKLQIIDGDACAAAEREAAYA